MVKECLNDLKGKLDEHNIMLTFSGPFSQEIIEVLGEAIKNHLNFDVNIKNKTFNVFSVFIEQTQNIKNYLGSKRFANESREFLNSGLVIIGKDNEHYYVYSGNMIEKNDTQHFVARLEEINQMNKEQLKTAYKSQIKKAREIIEGVSGGAGLGLLEIAKKSAKAIEYTLINIDEQFDYISIQVTI